MSDSIFDSLIDPFRTPEYEGGDVVGYDYDISKIIQTGGAALGTAGEIADLFGYDLFGGGSGGRQPTGYQGKIPTYTATRMQVPNTYDPDRRPGSGGQRYFTDVDYGGGDPAAQAAGLEALNKANMASRDRAGTPMPNVYAEREAAAKQAAAQQAAAQQAAAQQAAAQQAATQQPFQVGVGAYKSGGIVGFNQGKNVDNSNITEKVHKDGRTGLYINNGSTFVGYKEEEEKESEPLLSLDKFKSVVGLAKGGIAGLKEGRYLSGATDGMADEKPAMIDGEQPAALSDGEFVIPADVVSHLGNGNSDAGAKVLEDMMDRVRKERTGSTKQGKEINPKEFLPA